MMHAKDQQGSCRLHLQGLTARTMINTLHPVLLLASQLEFMEMQRDLMLLSIALAVLGVAQLPSAAVIRHDQKQYMLLRGI